MAEANCQAGESAGSTSGWFLTTQWSVVMAAGKAQSAEALNRLCATYWPPLYAYARRRVGSPEDAQDLTQSFFAKLLAKNLWERADPEKGRLRNFLLKAFQQFLLDERDKARAAKRGGGVAVVPLDEQTGEECFLDGLGRNLTPEQEFERQWALRLLEHARQLLRAEWVAAGKAELFDALGLHREEGQAAGSPGGYAELAARLGTTVPAIKSAKLRLRARYTEIVREEVSHTVTGRSKSELEAELEAELRHLRSVVQY